MRLQKMIAKIVIFLMLFVSVASYASPALASQAPYSGHGCSPAAVMSHCCSTGAVMSFAVSDTGDTCTIVKTTSDDNCCKDNQCHSGQIPIAILANELTFSPFVGAHHYKYLEGSQPLINQVIFRPPVIA
ncbi:hypothetical protein [Photobacterium rosenbergii]|uniref:hypothetical protein n=1 Tax=Photobacterium rosenbergii TaxID=294936 RepID=UPI001C99E27A|nr:hypothetical protein [Photobacterium rosenbergii]MBY5946953.1 hypothetical protein [Photobacterium rosenbergii]